MKVYVVFEDYEGTIKNGKVFEDRCDAQIYADGLVLNRLREIEEEPERIQKYFEYFDGNIHEAICAMSSEFSDSIIHIEEMKLG